MAYSIEGTQVPDLTGNNTWTGTNAFNSKTGNSSLSVSSSSLDAEGYPISTYTVYTAGSSAVTGNDALYTSRTVRDTGPGVIIQGSINSVNANSTEGYPAGLGVAKRLVGDTVYNAVWNDMVDCIEVPEDTDLEPGFAYSFDGKFYHKTTQYLDKGFIGIHSDTYGFGVGALENKKQLYVAIAGFVLAYVDKDYKPGTPLTCTKDGYLTELSIDDMSRNPHLLVGTFWKPENGYIWGDPTRSVLINGRKWVRVK